MCVHACMCVRNVNGCVACFCVGIVCTQGPGLTCLSICLKRKMTFYALFVLWCCSGNTRRHLHHRDDEWPHSTLNGTVNVRPFVQCPVSPFSTPRRHGLNFFAKAGPRNNGHG